MKLESLFVIVALSIASTARAQTPPEPDEAQVAAEAAVAEGAVAEAQRDGLAAQIRQRLGADAGGRCQGDAACREEMRAQVRACLRTAREQGAVKGPEDAAAVAAATLRLRRGDGAGQAGELVQTQLRRGWSARAVDDAAGEVERLRANQRWHRQARAMLRACADDQSCNAEQAHVALGVMRQASARADSDARQAARTVHQTLRENRAAKAGRDSNQLGRQLRQRLRLQDNGAGLAGGQGQQRRHRYRHQMAGEGERGGCFGGGMMQGGGGGMGPGRGGRR
jgi:hypothetical protein